MTQERRSQPRKPEAPARAGAGTLVPRAPSAFQPEGRGPKSQIQAMLTTRKSGWHSEGLRTATRDASAPHQQTSGGIQRP
jgi:hypothetical protein